MTSTNLLSLQAFETPGSPKPIREWAAEYRRRGLAICRIAPGEKRPRHKEWTLSSANPESFTDQDSIGIMAGRLSRDLVCIDLDTPEALDFADEFLPPTEMVEGRAGKPRSHRWYHVIDIPEELKSRKASGEIGGPRIKHFDHAETGKRILDFIGTGGQAVVPPSRHESGEVRRWEGSGEPATVAAATLWEAVCKLATKCGWKPKEKPVKAPAQKKECRRDRERTNPRSANRKDLLPLPVRLNQAQRFIRMADLARSGHGGHDMTFRVARYLRNDLALPEEVGRSLLDEYNERLADAGEETWSAAELDHKWESAGEENPDFPYGCKARRAQPERSQDPYFRLAEAFISDQHWVFWSGLFFEYTGDRYREVPDTEVRARLTRRIERCLAADHDDQLRRHALLQSEKFGSGGVSRPPTRMSVTRALVNNTLQALESLTNPDRPVPMPSCLPGGEEANWLGLTNGILDLDSGELLPHSPDWFSTVCLPYAFDGEARCERWLQILNQNLEGDAERIALLQEFFGYCLERSTDAQSCLVLVGDGGNGKSVMLAALHALLGPDNVSTVPLEDFARRFAMAQTLGKLANICAEVGELDKTAEGTLKAFISGDRMTFERKGKDPFSARPTARLVLSTNNLPRFADRTEGVWRRIQLVPFNRRVPEPERIPGMDKPEWWLRSGEVPGILNWALEGRRRLRERGYRFERPAACRAALDAHRRESDPCREFLQEHYVADEGAPPIPTAEVYQAYCRWCQENGHKAVLTAQNFSRQVRRVFSLGEPKAHRFKTLGRDDAPQKAWFGLASCHSFDL